MSPSLFLAISGSASLFIGILGILSPQFDPKLWFDSVENIVHTGYPIAAFIIATLGTPKKQWWFVLGVSLLTLIVAVGGLLVAGNPEPNFFITNLEHPIDNALHFTFVMTGFFAVWHGWMKGDHT